MKKRYKTTTIVPETRKTRRMRARYNILQSGVKRMNKKKADNSFFAMNWREYAAL